MQCVGFVHRYVGIAVVLAAQSRDQVAVEFNGMQVPGVAGKRIGNRTLPGADFNNDIVFGRVHRPDDGIDNAGVGQEVLAKAFARAVPGHQLCAMMAASSTAASRLPGRLSGAGNIEGRAVIDGGANDGQAERDVDRVAKARVLEHRQALVVVHREHCILVTRGRRERRVRRHRPTQPEPFGAKFIE